MSSSVVHILIDLSRIHFNLKSFGAGGSLNYHRMVEAIAYKLGVKPIQCQCWLFTSLDRTNEKQLNFVEGLRDSLSGVTRLVATSPDLAVITPNNNNVYSFSNYNVEITMTATVLSLMRSRTVVVVSDAFALSSALLTLADSSGQPVWLAYFKSWLDVRWMTVFEGEPTLNFYDLEHQRYRLLKPWKSFGDEQVRSAGVRDLEALKALTTSTSED